MLQAYGGWNTVGQFTSISFLKYCQIFNIRALILNLIHQQNIWYHLASHWVLLHILVLSQIIHFLWRYTEALQHIHFGNYLYSMSMMCDTTCTHTKTTYNRYVQQGCSNDRRVVECTKCAVTVHFNTETASNCGFPSLATIYKRYTVCYFLQ